MKKNSTSGKAKSSSRQSRKIVSQPPRRDQSPPEGEFLTTNQGVLISDNHNSLKAGVRGPTLMEDFVLREKITSFDHERIPERAVHARGAGAFGEFECTKAMGAYTSAGFLSEKGKKTPVLVRFSTVAGSRGSMDTARDVRGFATKFYTDEGNYDLVGNNIPVFFIQDAMKFPDLVHSVKPEQHNEIPQASSAHDTFWDFISLMPESTHMIFWAMSDRAIPRSFRMMEGFGVHSFRFVNAKGEGTFVKFHWKPKLGIHGLAWEEAQLLGGLDPDYHRRDLFESIENGDFPEWELGVQLVPESDEHKFDFDLLDPTKLIPEELVPVTIVGKMTLNRNPDNFFSEIEQAVFHPGHLVPGIDLTNDPLLQGRLFSYTDTQITRLGGPNFHELPVNRPLVNVTNHQRDGFGRQSIPKGRVAYEPNSLAKGCPFHSPERMKSYVHFTERVEGHKVRARSESFGDHFSQAKLFFASQTKPEQDHIKKAFTFELSKVETPQIRERMLQTIMMVNEKLAKDVAKALGMAAPTKGIEQPNPASPANGIVPENRSQTQGQSEEISGAKTKKTGSPKTSDALSMVLTNPGTPDGRKVALLVANAKAAAEAAKIQKQLKSSGVAADIVAPPAGKKPDEKALNSAPSAGYDGVMVLSGPKDFADPEDLGHALKFVAQSFKHCKTIGSMNGGSELVHKATMNMTKDEEVPGIYIGEGKKGSSVQGFTDGLSVHRHWEREQIVKSFPA